MAFATFANMIATSKQFVGYMKRFSSCRRAIQLNGSFNNDKGKKSVFMSLKAPPLPYTSTLHGCLVVAREFKKGLFKTNARVIKHLNCYFSFVQILILA